MMFRVLLGLLLAWTSFGAAMGKPIKFIGDFTNLQLDGDECKSIFEKRHYSVDFFLINMPRGAVLYFPATDDGSTGFFDRLNVVGSRGYNDLSFSKAIHTVNNERYTLQAEGLADNGLLILQFEVTKTTTSEPFERICSAKAEFAGFSKTSFP